MVWDNVHCYHTETSSSTDMDGNTTTTTYTVTTHNITEYFEYMSFYDTTVTKDLLALEQFPLTVVNYIPKFLFQIQQLCTVVLSTRTSHPHYHPLHQ